MTEREPRATETHVAGTPLPWRLRHPALSRALLYGLGLVVVLVALVLLRQRAADDAADHEAYLVSRLDQLDLLNFSTSVGRQAARQVLDEEYGEADLSTALRARVLRIEAQLDARDGLPERGLERLAAAKSMIHSPADTFGLLLEETTLLQMAGRGEEALRKLEDPALRLPASETLRLHHVITLAWLHAEMGNVEGARDLLEGGLSRWRGEPDEVSPAWVGTVRPTAVDTWMQATRYLCQLAPCSSGPWLRLARLFPREMNALAAASLGLLDIDAREDAAILWAQARLLNPEFAEATEAQRPELKGLQGIREDDLKPGAGTGR